MAQKLLLLIFTCCSLACLGQVNMTANELNVNKINFNAKYPIFLYGLKANFDDADSVAPNLTAPMRGILSLVNRKIAAIPATTFYKSSAITGDGVAAETALGVDFTKAIQTGTTVQRDSANYRDGQLFLNVSTNQFTVKILGSWYAFGLTPVR